MCTTTLLNVRKCAHNVFYKMEMEDNIHKKLFEICIKKYGKWKLKKNKSKVEKIIK